MLSVLSLVVVVDQITKAIVMSQLREGAATSTATFGVRLRHVANRRYQWGSRRSVLVVTIAWLMLIVAGTIVAGFVASASTHIALGGLLGGATGNLLDGILRNAVTDFIDLRVWPIFNMADAAIVAGALGLLWRLARFTGAM